MGSIIKGHIDVELKKETKHFLDSIQANATFRDYRLRNGGLGSGIFCHNTLTLD